MDTKQLEDIAKRLCDLLPTGIQHLEQDLQQKFKEILQVAFSKLDLVTRDEFDVQVKVLARTREKMDALQEQVNALIIKKS